MKNNLLSIDLGLFLPAIVLIIFSLTTLLSLNITYFRSQLIYCILSLAIFFFLSQIQFESFQYYAKPLYILSVIALFIVLLIGIESRGAVRWIDVLGLRIQFSEICKPILALVLASYLSEHTSRSFHTFVMTIVFLFPIVLLIFLQPDLGNALIYSFVTFLMLLVYGIPLIWFLLGLIPIVVISPIFWHFLHNYQRQRLLTFLEPTKDPLGTSYNVIQAMIAVGSGMWFGNGLNEGTQSGLHFLPERQTDFIFATIAEKFGFLGSVIVIVTFAYLLYRIYAIFATTDNQFAKLFAACAFFLILIHFLLNVGMNLGILPVVGVTLPFVSFGGSSLLSNFILLGILASISSQIKKKDALEIR